MHRRPRINISAIEVAGSCYLFHKCIQYSINVCIDIWFLLQSWKCVRKSYKYKINENVSYVTKDSIVYKE